MSDSIMEDMNFIKNVINNIPNKYDGQVVDEEGYWFVQFNRNAYSKSKYPTIEEAIKADKTNRNCFDCVDCENCKHCKACWDCKDCKYKENEHGE